MASSEFTSDFESRLFHMPVAASGYDYRDALIGKFAETDCQRISRRVILSLQRLKEGMQSGDDSPLANIWDEICVQVQGQESAMWEIYLQTTEAIIGGQLDSLSPAEKQAIWLQTRNGSEWMDDDGLQAPPYVDDDIADYILHEFVLPAAADWTNKRIRSYLERDCEMDSLY